MVSLTASGIPLLKFSTMAFVDGRGKKLPAYRCRANVTQTAIAMQRFMFMLFSFRLDYGTALKVKVKVGTLIEAWA